MTNDKINEMYKKRPKNLVLTIIISIIVISLFVWSVSDISFNKINPNGIVITKNIFKALLSPNWKSLLSLNEAGIPYLMLETIIIAFLGTIIGILFAIPIAFLSSRNITNKPINMLGNILIVLIRTLPAFVVGLVFIVVVGPGAFAGVLTISFTSIGMIAKLYIESIEEINKGIIESLDATGANGFQKIRFGIMPQLTANFVSSGLYRFDLNVRNAAILGMLGAGGIGFTLDAAIRNARWKDAAAALWGIIIVVLVIEIVSTKLRKSLIYGKK